MTQESVPNLAGANVVAEMCRDRLPILQASKMIYKEALDALHGPNLFHYDISLTDASSKFFRTSPPTTAADMINFEF